MNTPINFRKAFNFKLYNYNLKMFKTSIILQKFLY